MRLRFSSINDLVIKETERKYYRALRRHPDDHLGTKRSWFLRSNLFRCRQVRKDQAGGSVKSKQEDIDISSQLVLRESTRKFR